MSRYFCRVCTQHMLCCVSAWKAKPWSELTVSAVTPRGCPISQWTLTPRSPSHEWTCVCGIWLSDLRWPRLTSAVSEASVSLQATAPSDHRLISAEVCLYLTHTFLNTHTAPGVCLSPTLVFIFLLLFVTFLQTLHVYLMFNRCCNLLIDTPWP